MASEDNDDNPDCPYILEDVQTCAEKSLLILKAEQAMRDRQLKTIREDVKQSFANVPEPSPLLLVGLAGILMGVRKWRK
jgi:ethanolamine utilization protein EutA (predicted chaperonin)